MPFVGLRPGALGGDPWLATVAAAAESMPGNFGYSETRVKRYF
jgi:hypothetical protein